MAVGERPVFHPNLGKHFRTIRLQRRLGFRQVVRIANDRKLAGVTATTLGQLERGTVWCPEAVLIRSLSEIYKKSYRELAASVVAAVTERMTREFDLPRHEADQETEAPTLRGAYEAAADRVVELEKEIQERDARLSEVQDVASRLVQIAASAKGATARTRTRTRRGGDRKTG